jgi:hypothetical protein
MSKSVLILLTGLFISANLAWSQGQPAITFKSPEFDMGTMNEDGGVKSGTFEFSNTGDDTLRIFSIKPGSGCSVAEYTKKPVLPKENGTIVLSYDPRNRPGPFSKGVEVATNDPAQPRIILVLKGEVTPKPKTVADEFPHAFGNLRFNYAQIMLQEMSHTQIRTDSLKVYNDWGQTMTLSFSNLPDYVTIKAIPGKLKPGERGKIVLTYNANKREDFGFVFDRFDMETNDTLEPVKKVSLSVNIIEDFSKLTPVQRENAAVISFKTKSHKFSPVKSGERIEYDFEFSNTGKQDLIIRKIKGSSGFITYNLPQQTLKPGESGKIQAVYNTSGRTGMQKQALTVISNDPANSIIKLEMEGEILPAK